MKKQTKAARYQNEFSVGDRVLVGPVFDREGNELHRVEGEVREAPDPRNGFHTYHVRTEHRSYSVLPHLVHPHTNAGSTMAANQVQVQHPYHLDEARRTGRGQHVLTRPTNKKSARDYDVPERTIHDVHQAAGHQFYGGTNFAGPYQSGVNENMEFVSWPAYNHEGVDIDPGVLYDFYDDNGHPPAAMRRSTRQRNHMLYFPSGYHDSQQGGQKSLPNSRTKAQPKQGSDTRSRIEKVVMEHYPWAGTDPVSGGWQAQVGNRHVFISHNQHTDAAYVEFAHSRNERSLEPDKEVQPGSVDFYRKLQNFTMGLRDHTLPVSFSADQHHRRVYERLLKRSGFAHTHREKPGKGGPTESLHELWHPTTEEGHHPLDEAAKMTSQNIRQHLASEQVAPHKTDEFLEEHHFRHMGHARQALKKTGHPDTTYNQQYVLNRARGMLGHPEGTKSLNGRTKAQEEHGREYSIHDVHKLASQQLFGSSHLGVEPSLGRPGEELVYFRRREESVPKEIIQDFYEEHGHKPTHIEDRHLYHVLYFPTGYHARQQEQKSLLCHQTKSLHGGRTLVVPVLLKRRSRDDSAADPDRGNRSWGRWTNPSHIRNEAGRAPKQTAAGVKTLPIHEVHKLASRQFFGGRNHTSVIESGLLPGHEFVTWEKPSSEESVPTEILLDFYKEHGHDPQYIAPAHPTYHPQVYFPTGYHAQQQEGQKAINLRPGSRVIVNGQTPAKGRVEEVLQDRPPAVRKKNGTPKTVVVNTGSGRVVSEEHKLRRQRKKGLEKPQGEKPPAAQPPPKVPKVPVRDYEGELRGNDDVADELLEQDDVGGYRRVRRMGDPLNERVHQDRERRRRLQEGQ